MKFMKVNLSHQRALLWIALVMAIVYGLALVFLLEFFPPPAPTLSATDVVTLYAHSNLRFRIGAAIMLVVGAFNTPWSIVVSLQMARDELGAPTWAIMQSLAATINSFLFFMTPFMWGMAAFSVDRPPELTVLLQQCAWLIFTAAVSMFPFQIFPTAVVAFSKKEDPANSAFPRWIGWVTLLLGLSGTAGVSAMLFKTGPFAWNGLVPFYLPLSLFGIWMTCMSISMFRAIRLQKEMAQS